MFKVTTFADGPGYERTSSSLWKQREVYCAVLIQQVWRDHHKGTVSKGKNVRNVVTGVKHDGTSQEETSQSNEKKVIEVQPSPSPSN